MPRLDAKDLSIHLRSFRKRAPEGRVFAIHFEGRPPVSELEVDGEQWTVERAQSELALRAILVDETDGPVAALTPLRNRQTPDDIKARLAGGEIYKFDAWASLGNLFEASSIDARLRYSEGADAFADALLRASGGDAFSPVTGGFLDPDTAWNAFLRRGLSQTPPATELSEWLVWAVETPLGVRTLFQEYGDVLPALEARLEQKIGKGGPFLVGALREAVDDESVDPGVDALSVGLALDAALAAEADGNVKVATRAQTRLEGEPAADSETMLRYAEASRTAWTELVHDGNGRSSKVESIRTAVDKLVTEIAGEDDELLAEYSVVSAKGWDARLERFANALERLLDDGRSASDGLQSALSRLESHSEATRHDESLEQLRSAARLAYRLARQEALPDTLRGLAEHYVEDGSFIDTLRERLTVSDVGPIVTGAVERVVEAALERSERVNDQFADLLGSDLRNKRGTSAGLPIDHVLGRAIAPLAAETPVLLVVLDGLSWAVARALLLDDALERWEPWVPGTEEQREAMFATVPSVTKHSRTSLLTGKLQPGSQHVERDEFARALRDAGGVSRLKDAELFHKADVDSAGRGNVGENIEQALANSEKRVVGVVVNAIDDQLAGADQVSLEWSVDTVTPLRTLLKLARKRAVVLVGDHGHVWDTRTERTIGAASARWRPVGEELVDGERVFSGPMIQELTGESEIVAAWSETLRYTRGRRGYHGGASIQEIVTPLVVLGRDEADFSEAGFARLGTVPPSWWELKAPPKQADLETEDTEEDGGQLNLLAKSTDASVDTAWIRRFLETDRFQDRLDKFGHGISTDLVGRILTQLEANQHRLTEKELAGLLDRTVRRSRGIVVTLKNVLNREGYQVLKQDRREGMIRLDRGLLERQFGLKEQ